ncbi:stromal interaction molecule homolog isoform X1 [Argiope bruennichi]|uniref:stromal interaction molecule homolog isoform X1 n=1 Tax=Argiope bruennichi TaxID=94029 RepID=UPI002494F9CB|nr:stromal interaction molecule homolog isoform X1 [Argiope bruennichi]
MLHTYSYFTSNHSFYIYVMNGKNIVFRLMFLFCLSLFLAGKVDNIEYPKKETDLKSTVSVKSDFKELKSWNCELLNACDDKLGFDAILTLHQRLDDDADGNIDIVESDEFFRDELNYKSGYERQKRFHRNDKHISVDELWLTWKSSEVHNWTVEETIQWLVSYVDLPQYAGNFKENSIDGTSLPRLAVNNMHFLSNLGIKDPIHKHKISLKAMDVVLFGPPRNNKYFKDVILALSIVLATVGCWFAYAQHKKSQSHLRKTMKDLESLQRAEESLRTLQEELDKAKLEQERATTEKRDLERRLQDEKTIVKLTRQDSSGNLDGSQTKIQKLEQELRDVIEDLRCAERALHAKNWMPSPTLQHWLQLTHELELQHYNEKKAAAEKQLIAAKEGCEKLRKKRTSFMGAFRVAHSSAINDVDNRILQARTALSEVTKDLQERLSRWKEIEMLCGFPIVNNPGIRQLEAILGTSMSVTTPTSVTPRVARRNSEGNITDDETLSVLETGVSAIQHLVHNSATLFLAPLPSTHLSNFPSFNNCPSRSSPCQDDTFSLYQSGYLSFAQCDQSTDDGSITNIPIFCNQRSGYNIHLGSLRSIPSADLKTVASSNAILQRSNAFHYDPADIFEKERIQCSRENNLIGSGRPIFTVGESKDSGSQSFESMSRLHSQENNQDGSHMS